MRAVAEVCNTAWNHGVGSPQNHPEISEEKSLNQWGKDECGMRPSNFGGCYD